MHIDRLERLYIIIITVMLGIFMAALFAGGIIYGVRPPGDGGYINTIAFNNSEFANPGLRDMGNNEYEVTMVAQMWAFIPSEITVPVGSTVTFNIASRDVTHGFLIEHHNINFEIVPGHISRARVTFHEEGEFRYLCHEYCGRNHAAMHGVVNVVADTTELASNE